MVSEHLNHLLQRNSTHVPKAVVLESTGGQYCYAFRPEQEPQLKGTAYWNACSSWPTNNCCPQLLTEQYFYEHPEEYPRHPPTLLVGGDSDAVADPKGVRFYHDTMRNYSARSAIASWAGSSHGITPLAFGFAASFVKNALRAELPVNLKNDDLAHAANTRHGAFPSPGTDGTQRKPGRLPERQVLRLPAACSVAAAAVVRCDAGDRRSLCRAGRRDERYDSWEDHADLIEDGLEDMIELYDDTNGLLHNNVVMNMKF